MPEHDAGVQGSEEIVQTDLHLPELYRQIRSEISRVIVGQADVVDSVVIALFAGGHVLLEGVPGLGKTLLVRTLGQVFDMEFSRIQFTPDLMPSDITGTNILVEDPQHGRRFEFRRGPVFANLVLADEINRATPKTQSALLEAMQEGAVTVFGQSYQLGKPFFVLATENPLELEGTYPLPEAQLDRFMFKVLVNYPPMEDLVGILRRTTEPSFPAATRVSSGETLLRARSGVLRMPVSLPLYDYVGRLVLATNPKSDLATELVRRYVRFGASPRGAQAIIMGGKVRASLEDRHFVSYSDVRECTHMSLRHRLILKFEAEADNVTEDEIITDLVEKVKRQGEERLGRLV